MEKTALYESLAPSMWDSRIAVGLKVFEELGLIQLSFDGENVSLCCDAAAGKVNLDDWDAYFLARHSFVAEMDGKIVGFADMDDSGYLGRLYVHKDFLGLGIGTALCDAAENAVTVPKYTLHSSITARPFYEKRGYRTVETRQMERKDQLLTIYVMEK